MSHGVSTSFLKGFSEKGLPFGSKNHDKVSKIEMYEKIFRMRKIPSQGGVSGQKNVTHYLNRNKAKKPKSFEGIE